MFRILFDSIQFHCFTTSQHKLVFAIWCGSIISVVSGVIGWNTGIVKDSMRETKTDVIRGWRMR